MASFDTGMIYSMPELMRVVAEYSSRQTRKLFAVYGSMIETRSHIERIVG
jgi:hypothetical protein